MEKKTQNLRLEYNGRSNWTFETPFSELAAAVVKEAANQYIAVLRGLWDKSLSMRKKRNLVAQKIELEDFFHSQWYEQLTDIDPDKLLFHCRLNAKEKEKLMIERQNKRRVKKLLNREENPEEP